jgi:hypothetical protein
MQNIFLYHKQVACQGSVVFDRAFNGGFIEGQTQTYRLEDVTPAAFRLFSEWLYSKQLTLLDHDLENKSDPTEVSKDDYLMKCMSQDHILVELWILGDRFAVGALQNYVLKSMMNASRLVEL